MPVQARRAYDPVRASDGRRYLIDGLWPRGVTKEALELSGWMRELAPSRELRTWYGHDPARYSAFRSRFRTELEAHSTSLDRLATEARDGMVTLVFAARTADRCNASVLKELLDERLVRRAGRARRKPGTAAGRAASRRG